MKAMLRIAGDEWRMWFRSRLALAGLAVFMAMIGGTATLTAARMSTEKNRRLEQQSQANRNFAEQPARHPHRMVHYGHYVFRPPAPLTVLDPGVDAVTGESIFLEGHRQNSATFADARADANVGGFGRLTPAVIYQIFLPLLLIALGHGVILREREAGTLASILAQGTTPLALMLGKGLALVGLVAIFVVPAVLTVLLAVLGGGSVVAAAGLVVSYAAYLLIWAGVVLLASLLVRERGLTLGILLVTWLVWTLVVPRFAVTVVSHRHPTPSKLETDLQMQAELRKAGDGHNITDTAFSQLRARLLAQHGVDRVEDLPVNIRGVIAEASEAKLTEVLNRYAEARMAREAEQEREVATFGWLSPTIALGSASRTLAGTDLVTHHRFLRAAEALRFDFVQGLNRLHAHKLAYRDDVLRSRDPVAEQRTRVSAQNWSLLEKFTFSRADAAERILAAVRPGLMLLLWAALIAVSCVLAAGRLSP